ncbi:MAG: NAD-dependent epimerase/dehydratase family protein [Bacteroidota bacterium]
MIFLTGGTGLLGIRILYDLISNKRKVLALKRKSSPLQYVKEAFLFYDPEFGAQKFDSIHWIEGDVLDVISLQKGMEECDEVYHAAAMVSFHKRDRQIMLDVNIKGTANVVNVAVENEIKKFCHISSIAALGRSGNARAITEEDLWTDEGDPSYYSISKYYSEMEVWRGIEEGLNAVILCPSLILGAGRPEVSSGKIYSAVWEGLKVCGPNSNSIIDVRSISKAAIELMEKEIWKERFILSAHDLKAKKLFDTVAKSLGKNGPKRVMSERQIKFFMRFIKLLSKLNIEPRISYETLSGALMNYTYDNTKLEKYIAIEYPSIEESIAYYANYYKKILGSMAL